MPKKQNKNKKASPPVRQSKATSSNAKQEALLALQQEQCYFAGPLPSPQTFAEYDKIVPGAAERILVMAEKDAEFQRAITHKALKAEASERRLGQILGFCIGLASLITTGIALFFNQPTAASIIGGTTVVGLVTVFVLGRDSGSKKQAEDKEAK